MDTRPEADPGWTLLCLGADPVPSPGSGELARGLLTFVADPSSLLERAAAEGMCGLLYTFLERSSLLDAAPPILADGLREAYLETARRNAAALWKLADLLGSLEAVGIPVVLLKGAGLLRRVYEHDGHRPMSDVDLWVRPKDLPTLRSHLDARGLQADPLYPHTFRRGPLTIDLHTDPLGADRIRSRRRILRRDTASLFEASRPWEVEGATARIPDPRDEIVLLCLHALKHNADRLIWLVDIHRLLASSFTQGDVRGLATHASSLGQQEAFLGVLALLGRLPGLRIPTWYGEVLRERGPSPRVVRLVARRALGGDMPEWAPLITFAPSGDLRSRVWNLAETLFPRPVVMRQVFPGARRVPLPLIYAARAGQIVLWGGRAAVRVVRSVIGREPRGG